MIMSNRLMEQIMSRIITMFHGSINQLHLKEKNIKINAHIKCTHNIVTVCLISDSVS